MRHKKAQKFNDNDIVRMPEKEENVIYIEFGNQRQKDYYHKLYSIAKQRYDYYKAINNIGRGSISILSSLHGARQACSGYIYDINEIEQQLSDAQARTFRVKQMVNKMDPNLSRAELFAIAKEEAFGDKDGECPICFECPFDEPLQTPCRHIFCRECIISILMKRECPMCRSKVRINQLKTKKRIRYDKDERKEMIKKRMMMMNKIVMVKSDLIRN